MKKAMLAVVLILAATAAMAEHKIRLSAAGGYNIENGLTENGTSTLAAKLTIAYPVSPKGHAVNTEIGIVSIYEAQLSGGGMQVPGFGFGIRIFYNEWGFIRPYFNHEILTRIINAAGREGSAKTFSVLLGLGVDIPLQQDRAKETGSIFADLAYVFYDAGFFEIEPEKVRTLCLTAGYSFPF